MAPGDLGDGFAYAMESGTGSTGYRDLPDSPTFRQPVVNLQPLQGPEWTNNLEWTDQPDDLFAADSRALNRMGTFGFTGTLVDENAIEDFLFTASSNTAFPSDGSSEPPSATWYLGANVPGVSQERFLEGGAPQEVSFVYNQGQEIQTEWQFFYAFEPDSVTAPASISQPSEGDVFDFAGMSVQIGGVDVANEEIQSLTYSIPNIATPGRGQSEYVIRPRYGQIRPTIQMNNAFVETKQVELAWGSDSATTPESTVSQVAMTLSFSNSNSKTIEFSFNAKADVHAMENLAAEEDTGENVTFHTTRPTLSVTT